MRVRTIPRLRLRPIFFALTVSCCILLLATTTHAFEILGTGTDSLLGWETDGD